MAISIGNTPFSLEIQKMPEGGYIVGDGSMRPGDFRQLRFASTSIDEAMKYVKSLLEPKPEK